MIKVCVFADEVSKEDFDEAVKLSVEAGADTVEVRGGIWGKHVTQIDDDDVKRMQDVLAKYGATVASIGSPFGKCSHEDEEEYQQHLRYFDRMVELAHAFETDVIRGFAFWQPNWKERGHPRANIDDYLDIVAEKLAPIVPIAESGNVTLSFENEGATLAGTCEDTRKVIDALGNSPALTSCWDVNNGLHCGENPLPDGYAHIKGLVTHLHIKPNKNKNLNPIDDTCTTYEQLLQTLVDDGYSGAASIEHWGGPELMLEGVRQLRTTIDEMGI